MRKLYEATLSKQETDDLTKRWFDIKKNDSLNNTQKRKAFDELYDEATDEFFGEIKTVKGYNDVKNFMHKQWLEMGFEAADGNDKSMNLTSDLIKRTNTAGNSDAASHLVPYILKNYNYIDDYLDSNDETSKLLKFFITQRKDLWSSYSEQDITNILGAIYDKLKNADSKEQNKIIQEFLTADNLRNFLTAENTASKRVRTSQINKNSSIEDIEKVMNDIGLLSSDEIKGKVQNILKK